LVFLGDGEEELGEGPCGLWKVVYCWGWACGLVGLAGAAGVGVDLVGFVREKK